MTQYSKLRKCGRSALKRFVYEMGGGLLSGLTSEGTDLRSRCLLCDVDDGDEQTTSLVRPVACFVNLLRDRRSPASCLGPTLGIVSWAGPGRPGQSGLCRHCRLPAPKCGLRL